MGSSTPTTVGKDLPPDWRPRDNIDLAGDLGAHAVWCFLFDIEGDDLPLETLNATTWWRPAAVETMERLVRYGLLERVVTQGGELLGWHRTEKGRAWTIESCLGALTAGAIKLGDAPTWFLAWLIEHQPGFADGAQRELARRTTKRVRR